MSVPTTRARTEPPASIFKEVIAVIVNLDTMETTVKMVISHLHFFNSFSVCLLEFAFLLLL